MFKKTFTTTNLAGETVERTVYFDMTKMDLAKLINDQKLDFMNRLNGFQQRIAAKEDVTVDEMTDLLNLLIKAGYRKVRHTEDGDFLVKDPEMAEVFVNSSIGEDFLYSLFDSPDELTSFFQSILPADVAKQAAAEIKSNPKQLDSLTPEQMQQVMDFMNQKQA